MSQKVPLRLEKCHDWMKFWTQIDNKISIQNYSSSKILALNGVRQGARNGGNNWTFISIPMIELVEKVAHSFTITLPRGEKQ